MRASIADRVAALLWPAGTAVAVVAAWYGAVLAFHIPPYLLPLPGAVLDRMREDAPFLARHTSVTAGEALGGFVLSALLGIALALLIVSFRVADRALMPWLVLSQTFPKIALAPLVVVWFGLGFGPKLAVTFLVAFFPVVIGTVVGLRSAEREVLELARSLRAGWWATLWYFRFPLALPSMFAGLKIAVAFSVVGAVIAEWVGATEGLGYLLLQANANLDTTLLFAVLAALTAVGLVLYYTVEAAERLAIPWHESHRLNDLSASP